MNAEVRIEADPLMRLEIALATALPELEGAKKSKVNPGFKSKYADLGSVIEAIRPIAEHGIWYRQVLHECETGVKVETLYTGFGATISAGSLHIPSDKSNAQGFGSALTYARRYALQSAFGLASEDDDGNAASAPRAAKVEAPEVVSDGQWAELVALMQSTKTDVDKFCLAYDIGSAKELRAVDFPTAKKQLQRKLEQMVQAEKEPV